ncbi:hypothetical protein BZA77DRAFT_238252 [Pyronema omphalodes]|nr:hypothetical protein BZA77DRAFT_238252 [Pyronema omphalodes]
MYHTNYGTDSYFTTHSNPSSTSSTPAPGRAESPRLGNNRNNNGEKRTSISSLLSSPDNSSGHDSSPASSPGFNWSDGGSPVTAITTRSNSVVNTPNSANGPCFEPLDYGMGMGNVYGQEEDKAYTHEVGPIRKNKTKTTPRTPNATVDNANRNREGYDVLGRKKPKTPRTPMSWDPKDDILLKQLKEEQRLGWKEIATHFHGRTSHACQFRWRRLASGQLKYYQGHRRPPPVTTTSASFANEMASTATAGSVSASPKVLMNGLHHNTQQSVITPPRVLHAMPHMPPSNESSLPPMHNPALYQQHVPHSNWGQSASLYQPTPLPSPTSYAPRFMFENQPQQPRHWSEEEDAVLMNRKLSFDEVNVLLAGRTEGEIWERQVKLRESEIRRHSGVPMHCVSEVRGDHYGGRIPGIGALAYPTASR